MKNVLLGVIATCLILITGKMYLGNMQTAQAQNTNIGIKPIVYAICLHGFAQEPKRVNEPHFHVQLANVNACYTRSISKN